MGVDHGLELKAKICKDWIRTQKHLPQNIGTLLLMRYVNASEGNIEDAKKLIEFSYTLRSKLPNVFVNRDPMEAKSQLAFRATELISLPKPTPENYNLFICRLSPDFDVNKMDFDECAKSCFMTLDTWSALPFSKDQQTTDGDVPIFDMTGLSFRHITKIVIATLRISMKYLQEGHCFRLKQIHVINCSALLEKIMFVLKPFINQKFADLFHYHAPNSDTLEKFFPKHLLPVEYGGKTGTLAELKYKWQKHVESHREYLMDSSRWVVDDSKRVKQAKPTEAVFTGSFKRIEFD